MGVYAKRKGRRKRKEAKYRVDSNAPSPRLDIRQRELACTGAGEVLAAVGQSGFEDGVEAAGLVLVAVDRVGAAKCRH